jgi:hypothetical protein
MPRKPRGAHTLVFWGAGATQQLGIRTTPDPGKFIYTLAGANLGSKSLDGRVAEALAESNREPWRTDRRISPKHWPDFPAKPA